MNSLKNKEQKEKIIFSRNEIKILESLKAIAISFLIGFLLIIVTGQWKELINFFLNIFSLSFGSVKQIANFLGKIAYMIPLGLSLAIGFRMGLFNIGVAGQAMSAGLISFYFASNINIGSFGFVLTIIIGILAGALISFLIAFLKNTFKINEVISSIMINWIVFYILKFFSPEAGDSMVLIENNDLRMEWLSNLFHTSTVASQINIGILIVVPIPFILFFIYKKTLWGYKQELIGCNPNVGNYVGINEKIEIYKTMILSGVLAGLAGVIYYVGYKVNLPSASIDDIPSWCFEGITIALISFNSPLGILISTMLMGMLTFPSNDLDLVIGGFHIVNIMVAILIILIARSNYRIKYGKISSNRLIKLFKFKKRGVK